MASTMSLQTVSAVTLFVQNLEASKEFYTKVFDVPVLFEDETSCAVKFNNLIVNLLIVTDAHTLVGPAKVGGPADGKRFQLSIWVSDIELVYEKLVLCGVEILSGPVARPWGMTTVTFVDPSGHAWEVGQTGKKE
jgi:catechol 2,3-dioxygenase-like lactoylglutathione lyase family enzyme